MKSPFKFSQHGESGKWVSEIFPNIARHVDRMALVHSGKLLRGLALVSFDGNPIPFYRAAVDRWGRALRFHPENQSVRTRLVNLHMHLAGAFASMNEMEAAAAQRASARRVANGAVGSGQNPLRTR